MVGRRKPTTPRPAQAAPGARPADRSAPTTGTRSRASRGTAQRSRPRLARCADRSSDTDHPGSNCRGSDAANGNRPQASEVPVRVQASRHDRWRPSERRGVRDGDFISPSYIGNDPGMLSADDPSERPATRSTDEWTLSMLHPKACPRCSGDLSLVEDIGDSYLSCLQCGFVSYQLPAPQATAPQRRHR